MEKFPRGGGIFNPKIYVAYIGNFKQGFLSMKLIKRRVISGFRVCFFNNCIEKNPNNPTPNWSWMECVELTNINVLMFNITYSQKGNVRGGGTTVLCSYVNLYCEIFLLLPLLKLFRNVFEKIYWKHKGQKGPKYVYVPFVKISMYKHSLFINCVFIQ